MPSLMATSLRWRTHSAGTNYRVSIGLGLDNLKISESRWVSVSTTLKFQSLNESRSRQLENFRVSMSLGLDISGNLSLAI